MFGRKTPPAPCPACAAKDVHIASLERQLALVSERLYSLHGVGEYEPVRVCTTCGAAADETVDEEEPEPLSLPITNAISFIMYQIGEDRDSRVWSDVEEKVRLLLAEGVGESEIVRRIRKSDWEGLESAEANAEGMR